jgi:coenzyme F420-reducing hydrogenase alpha subunit
VAQINYPAFEREYEYVALRHAAEYPRFEGRIMSTKGLDIGLRDYDRYFIEQHVPYSNALHSIIKDSGTFCVGPQARYNLNFDRLSNLAQEAARAAGLGPLLKNPFQSIVVRSVEALEACAEALRIISEYEMPDRPAVDINPLISTGCAGAEAPHGILYHRYRVDENGIIRDAKIVPPSTQNQKAIEEDLRHFVPAHVDLPGDKLRWHCEQAVRNYAPCLSCATH